MKKIAITVLIAIQIMNFSCESNEPVLLDDAISLSVIDAAVGETYLNVNIANPYHTKEFVIERNGRRVISVPASSSEIAITDTGLIENTTYKYIAKLYEEEKLVAESSEISITTLKPSSHDFVWETFTFGEYVSSGLYDVAIIDENNIWAVGEIYLKDSTGQIEPHYYNLAKWDGSTWHLSRVYYYQNGAAYLTHLRTIQAFNKDDIWLGGANRWNGKDYVSIPLNISFPYQIFEMWGTSSSNFYIVGNEGSIARYNGKYWERIESGMGNVYDFHSVFGRSSKEPIIFACTSTETNNSKILIYFDKQFSALPFNERMNLYSIWYATSRKIYIAGSYFYIYENGKYEKVKELSNQISTSIKGNSSNDIVVVGIKGIINHYDGKNWKSYNAAGEYSSVDIKNNTVVAVGTLGERAVVTIGRRK